MHCYIEATFRVTLKKHEKNYNGVDFFQYSILKLTGSGMQVRLHDCEKMNVYLLSSNGFKFFIDICNNAIKNIQEDVDESISGAQLSRINQLIALREAVNDASKTIRWVFFFSLVVTRYLRFL